MSKTSGHRSAEIGAQASGQTSKSGLVANASHDSSSTLPKRSSPVPLCQINCCGMLGCTSATASLFAGGGTLATRKKPQPQTKPSASNGRATSAVHDQGLAGERRICSTANSRLTDAHTTKNDTPYTPATEAIWISGRFSNWLTPRKFHG